MGDFQYRLTNILFYDQQKYRHHTWSTNGVSRSIPNPNWTSTVVFRLCAGNKQLLWAAILTKLPAVRIWRPASKAANITKMGRTNHHFKHQFKSSSEVSGWFLVTSRIGRDHTNARRFLIMHLPTSPVLRQSTTIQWPKSDSHLCKLQEEILKVP